MQKILQKRKKQSEEEISDNNYHWSRKIAYLAILILFLWIIFITDRDVTIFNNNLRMSIIRIVNELRYNDLPMSEVDKVIYNLIIENEKYLIIKKGVDLFIDGIFLVGLTFFVLYCDLKGIFIKKIK